MTLMLHFVFIILASTTATEAKFEAFKIGGQHAEIEDFPHAVFLSIKKTSLWLCGASVVNQRILLTAAHCLHECVETTDGGTTCQIYAYAGSAVLNTMQVVREVEALKCHEHYEDTFVENDVALALVQSLPLRQGLPIKRVMLMRSFPKELKEIQISGWGISDDTLSETSPKLKTVTQWILPREVCERKALKHPGTMCAGSSDNYVEEPTSGDSGSAVVTLSHQQIGLVSYRSAIEDPSDDEPKTRRTRRKPPQNIFYYTNVSYYYDWIEHNAVAIYSLHC